MDVSKEKGDDFVEKCMDPTILLQQCMEKHPEYYAVGDEEAEEEYRRERQKAADTGDEDAIAEIQAEKDHLHAKKKDD